MRVLLIAVLMCLLPMRGWAATAMATTMAAHQVAAAQASPTSEMPPDCAMHPEANTPSASGSAEPSGLNCSGCDTCELCLAMASFTSPSFHATPFSPSSTPGLVPQGFVSADDASPLKPPIS